MGDDEEGEAFLGDELRTRLAATQQARERELQRKILLRHLLDANAYERIMNVRQANFALYEQVVTLLAYLYQNKQLAGKVSDEKLLKLLEQVAARKREPTIEIKKK